MSEPNFTLRNTVILTLVLALIISSVGFGTSFAVSEFYSDDGGYGIVTATGNPSEDSNIIQYSSLSESEQDSFRNSVVYIEGETLKHPDLQISSQLESVDYIQLDGTYYRVAEHSNGLGPELWFLYTMTIIVSLIVLLLVALPGVFFTGLKYIDDLDTQFFSKINISKAQAFILFNIVLLVLAGGYFNAPDERRIITTTEVEETPDSATVTQFESLNWTQQYEFKQSLGDYERLDMADDSLKPYVGEYIQSDGEYYAVSHSGIWHSETISVLVSMFIFGNAAAIWLIGNIWRDTTSEDTTTAS